MLTKPKMKPLERLLHLGVASLLTSCGGGDTRDTRPPSGTKSVASALSSASVTRAMASAASSLSPASTPPLSGTVTLLTGHRVTVHPGGAYTVAPPAGGTGALRAYRTKGHLHVVPAEAEALLAADRLDPSLFDVTKLLELGYDDAHRSDLPLIVKYQRAGMAARATGAPAGVATSLQAVRPLSSIGGAAGRAVKGGTFWATLAGGAATTTAPGRAAAPALAGPAIAKIWLDSLRRPLLDRSTVQIGVPAARAAGFTGAGVKVAVIDSGIAASHPDFAGRIVESKSFVEGIADATDEYGHGTHVASIIAGSGAAEAGRYAGVAPESTLLVAKVCDGFGLCPDSAIIAALEWAGELGASVVNLSLGTEDGPEVDPVEEAVNALTAEHGTLVVASSGNLGSFGRVESPSTAAAALSVGAVDRQDALAFFSSTGPRIGDDGVKPEISAPGVGIVAARAAGTLLGDVSAIDDFYAQLSGTSMATPHVAGAAALLAQQHPSWRAAELKAALMASARWNPDEIFAEGSGRVDVARAVLQNVFMVPSSESFGRAPWPHDDEPIQRTVTCRNESDADVHLTLGFEIKAVDGAPAASDMFSVTPSEVTVPAHGAAEVTVTADTRTLGPDGTFVGALVATAPDQLVRMPLSITKEAESYDLAIEILDREGSPVDAPPVMVDLDSGSMVDLPSSTAGVPVRMPRGRYSVISGAFAVHPDGTFETVVLVSPFELSGPTSLTMDGRLARPFAITVPSASAHRFTEGINYIVRGSEGSTGFGYLSGSADDQPVFYSAQLGPSLPGTHTYSVIQSDWLEPDSLGATRHEKRPDARSPDAYHTIFLQDDGLPTGFVRQVERAELAAVESEYASVAPSSAVETGSQIANLGTPASIADSYGPSGIASELRLPTRRTEYLLAKDVLWSRALIERDLASLQIASWLNAPPATYEPGRTTRNDRWNEGVIGPSFTTPLGLLAPAVVSVVRSADEIRIAWPSYFSDAANHYGGPPTAGASRLFREEALIGVSPSPVLTSFPVPADPGEYRLEVELRRDPPVQIATQITLAWTFHSQRSADGSDAPLPLFTVRFTPPLDERNTAPAGRVFILPLEVSRQPGAPASPISELVVEASFDQGATWRAIPVLKSRGRKAARLRHPNAPGSTVSLRARACDRNGNTVEQTILDAYALRSRWSE